MPDTDMKIAACEAIIHYDFIDKIKCAKALNASGLGAVFLHDGWHRAGKNDRLALYGNAIAAFVLCRRWFRTGRDKGCWDNARQDLIGNANLHRVGVAHGLDMCVNLNAGTATVSNKTMATTVEAILGAVHLDGGDNALVQVMEQLDLMDHPNLEVVFFMAASGVPPAAESTCVYIAEHGSHMQSDAAGSRESEVAMYP